MTFTITHNTHQALNPTLILHWQSSPNFQTCLKELLNIIRQHQGDSLPGSFELITATTDLYEFVLNHFSESESFVAEVVNKMLHLKRLLQNPLDRSYLITPVAANGYIWEQWIFDHVKRLGGLSPFDNRPLEQAVEHRFAKALLAWECLLLKEQSDGVGNLIISRYCAILEGQGKRGCLKQETVLRLDPQKALAGYRALAARALNYEREKRFSNVLHETNETIVQQLREADHLIAHHQAAICADLLASERLVWNQFKATRESHERFLNALEGQVRHYQRDSERVHSINQTLMRENEILLDSISFAMRTQQTLSNRIASLENTHRQLEQQNAENSRRANSRKGGCSIS